MANNESDEDREKRIEELKRRAEELAGGDMTTGEFEPDVPRGRRRILEARGGV